MHPEKIHIERIRKFVIRLKQKVYADKTGMTAECIYNQDEPIPYSQIDKYEFGLVNKDDVWGKTWGSAWFRFSIIVPESHAGKAIGAWIDLDGEACVWKDGSPWLGLTNKVDWYHNAGKHYVPIYKNAKPGERIELLVEAAANDLFGAGKQEYKLVEASLVSYDAVLFNLIMDLEVLFNLAEHLPEKTVRRQKIIYGLNEICNIWQDGKKVEEAEKILQCLYSYIADCSALTAYSVGHAHIDLAWLWPVRETIRKGGRTFATALRMMELYHEYIFGASQAQLYKWIKQHYPALYNEVKQAAAQGRWEIQGAGWVEFDTNLTGGESIIRQMFYGKRYFQEEFGNSPDVLWLPDCFGFNANLPQLMLGCGVKYFLTQKLSWNESDTFPYHLFIWQGIDGSEVLAHQLPTNDYNFSNSPKAFLETEKRFAQCECFDEFLNLYGIGDGGGGPGIEHIEYGLCQRNLEGVAKFRFSKAQAFFEKLSAYDRKVFPKWCGELYLQYHRGTYTTQALMKKNNRTSERLLHDAEFAAVLTGKDYPAELTAAWEDIMLMQFHDIIPGSSINWVYKDAQALSEKNHAFLNTYISDRLETVADGKNQDSESNPAFLVFNTQSWNRQEWVQLTDAKLNNWVRVSVPAYGYSVVSLPVEQNEKVEPFTGILENDLLKVIVSERGTILSIYDKVCRREVLTAPSNILKLWEDEPNNWGAWDINHFYRDTEPGLPDEVTLLNENSFVIRGSVALAMFRIRFGKSIITQVIELIDGEKFIRFNHSVDWQEHHRMLRVHFYPDLTASDATYEIQFGAVKRPTRHNTSWEKALFEVPAHCFADLSEPDYGTALINDCKYGYRIVDNEMELNLLRSPADVDPEADIHQHTYSYAFYPHAGCFEQSDVVKVAHCFNSKMYVLPVSNPRLGEARSFFSVVGDKVKLETVKPCETGDGIILRLYEYSGSNASVKLRTVLPFSKAYLCNMLEEIISPEKELEQRKLDSESTIDLDFKPFEIKTLLLR
jgi:alpha-mannosidase